MKDAFQNGRWQNVKIRYVLCSNCYIHVPLLILKILFFVKMWPIGAGVMATKRFGFYDGVARILGQRILDFVLFQALCGFWGLTL